MQGGVVAPHLHLHVHLPPKLIVDTYVAIPTEIKLTTSNTVDVNLSPPVGYDIFSAHNWNIPITEHPLHDLAWPLSWGKPGASGRHRCRDRCTRAPPADIV